MKPKNEFITITNNLEKIVSLLYDLVLTPRLKALEWSKITKQTPNIKIGYPGQHLASLITGVEGARTGARGDDLIDGTEVKSCSRVDQLDTCKNCKSKVLRIEDSCPACKSNNITRMDDSKWLFAIKSEKELNLLTKDIDRVLLTIADYPFFSDNNFETIRFQAFEIWNKTDRHKHFTDLMNNYYNKIYLEHIKLNASKTPAPKNFWPYSYQFYLCNPVKVFSCIVDNANIDPKVNIEHFIEPSQDRSQLASEDMPTTLLTNEEWNQLIDNVPEYTLNSQIAKGRTYQELISNKNNKTKMSQILPNLNEETRNILVLRDTDRVSEAKATYSRRKPNGLMD